MKGYMLINDYHLFLEFDGGDADLEDYDALHYMYITRGTVVGADEEDKRTIAGSFRVSYIDVGAAMNAGASVFDIFDYTQELCDYYSAIFDDETLNASAELNRLFEEDIWPGNVLILDRLEILPEFRGHDLGLVVIRRLIERFGAGAGVVAMTPFPLQHGCARDDDGEDEEEKDWRQKMRYDNFDKNLQRAIGRLRRYYAKLGFKLMKGTPFMFRDAQRPLPVPSTLAADARP
jgi:GNAT superfamily N-acetyltransferase